MVMLLAVCASDGFGKVWCNWEIVLLYLNGCWWTIGVEEKRPSVVGIVFWLS